MNINVEEVVKLYFQGCSVEKAIKIIRPDIKQEVLERIFKNYCERNEKIGKHRC